MTSSTATATTKPPLPPFTAETAQIKVKGAQDLWNTRCVLIRRREGIHSSTVRGRWGRLISDIVRNPSIVKNGYTPDSVWRNKDTFLKGHDEIVGFLTKKWAVENGYRLRRELFAFTDNKVSPCFIQEGRSRFEAWIDHLRLITMVHKDLAKIISVDCCPILVRMA